MQAAHLGFCGSRQGVLHARRPRRPGSRPGAPALRCEALGRLATRGGRANFVEDDNPLAEFGIEG